MSQAVNLTMPFASLCHPDLEAARLRNLEWARNAGLVLTEVDQHRYLRWDMAGLIARWIPRASAADLDLGIDSISVAVLLDEHFDGDEAPHPDYVEEVCATVFAILEPGGLLSAPSGVIATALADVWARHSRGVSPWWERRSAMHWRWFFEAFIEEARRRKDPVSQSIDSYMELRRKSGFVYPMLDMIEKSGRFETTDRARQVPGARRLILLAIDIVNVMNDVFSIDKEVSRGDVHNFVPLLQDERGLSREEALAEAYDSMNRWSEEFLRVEAGLPAECARQRLSRTETDNLLRLVEGLKEAIGGQPDWYRVTGRYGNVIPKGEPAYGSNLLSGVVSPR